MKIVLIQSDEVREADFLKDVLEQLAEGRRKYGKQSLHDLVLALTAKVELLGDSDVLSRQRLRTNCADAAVIAMRIATEIDISLEMADFFDEQFPDMQMTAEEKSELLERIKADENDPSTIYRNDER